MTLHRGSPSAVRSAVLARLDALAKPPGSLGRLEELAVRLAVTQGRIDPLTRPRRAILFAGDHGVVAEGTGPWPSRVTASMIRLILSGKATSAVLARQAGADLVLVDAGSLIDPAPTDAAYRDRRIARGTANLARGAAMTSDQFDAAWEVGARAAREAHADGIKVLVLGEMGIGNSTPAAALAALLTGEPAAHVVGPGAGLAEAGLARKRAIVSAAVERSKGLLATNPIAAIAGVAGFELAALAGCISAAALLGITAVLDGYIVGAAALVAEHLAPGAKATAIVAHISAEPGHRIILEHLGLTPFLAWDLRLGEGTGALLLLPPLDAAAALLTDVATLAEVLATGSDA